MEKDSKELIPIFDNRHSRKEEYENKARRQVK
jgi:hypothetical protein